MHQPRICTLLCEGASGLYYIISLALCNADFRTEKCLVTNCLIILGVLSSVEGWEHETRRHSRYYYTDVFIHRPFFMRVGFPSLL